MYTQASWENKRGTWLRLWGLLHAFWRVKAYIRKNLIHVTEKNKWLWISLARCFFCSHTVLTIQPRYDANFVFLPSSEGGYAVHDGCWDSSHHYYIPASSRKVTGARMAWYLPLKICLRTSLGILGVQDLGTWPHPATRGEIKCFSEWPHTIEF